ncbi:MAG: hypothetical protein AAF747_08325 [Planctomycetota bacterium]
MADGRNAWKDRFTEPEVEELLDALPEEVRELFDSVRDKLWAMEGLVEELGWHGIPMRWTLAFYPDEGEAEEPIAYMVPNPEGARFVVPLQVGCLDGLQPRRLSKTLREGLGRGNTVAGVMWTEWEFASANLLDEVLKLITRSLATRSEAS